MTSPMLSEIPSICVFDLETTGVDVFEDRVVTAYVGRMNRAGEITGSYNWLVNPGVPIADEAAAVHGISNEVAAREGQDARTAITEIMAVLRRSQLAGRPVAAFNGAFDWSMINEEADRYGVERLDFFPAIDGYIVDKNIDMYRRGSRKLIDVSKHYGVELIGAHDAEADAIATGRTIWAVIDAFIADRKYGDMNLADFHTLQKRWALEGAASFQEYLRDKKGQPDAVINGEWPVRTKPEGLPERPVPNAGATLAGAVDGTQGRVAAGNGEASGQFTDKVQTPAEVAL